MAGEAATAGASSRRSSTPATGRAPTRCSSRTSSCTTRAARADSRPRGRVGLPRRVPRRHARPDLTVEDVTGDGDRVAARWTLAGRTPPRCSASRRPGTHRDPRDQLLPLRRRQDRRGLGRGEHVSSSSSSASFRRSVEPPQAASRAVPPERPRRASGPAKTVGITRRAELAVLARRVRVHVILSGRRCRAALRVYQASGASRPASSRCLRDLLGRRPDGAAPSGESRTRSGGRAS